MKEKEEARKLIEKLFDEGMSIDEIPDFLSDIAFSIDYKRQLKEGDHKDRLLKTKPRSLGAKQKVTAATVTQD